MKEGTQEVKILTGESIRREVQSSVSDIELGWISGMITGEGSIGAYLVKARRTDRPDLDGKLAFRASVKIAGGMLEDIQRVKTICEKFGVRVHLTWNKRKDRKFLVGNAEINGQANVERLLKRILPYIGSKKPQAELMLEMITYRSTLVQPGVPGSEANADTKLQTMIKRLSDMKQEGKTTESLNDCTPGAELYKERRLRSKVTRALKTASPEQFEVFVNTLS